MTVQALLSTAEEILAGDRRTLAMAQSTVTCISPPPQASGTRPAGRHTATWLAAGPTAPQLRGRQHEHHEQT